MAGRPGAGAHNQMKGRRIDLASTLDRGEIANTQSNPTSAHYDDDATLVVVATGTSAVCRNGVSLFCWSMGCFAPEESFRIRWQ